MYLCLFIRNVCLAGEEKERSETFLGKELPALAREVARVEAVRVYAGE